MLVKCLNDLRSGSRKGRTDIKEIVVQCAKHTQLMQSMSLFRGSGGMLPQKINTLRLNLEAILTGILKYELTASSIQSS